MLVSRKVCNDIETLFFAENTFKYRVCKIKRIATELIWNEETFCASYIAHQFCQSILIEVNYHNRLRFEAKYGLDEAGTYRPCSSNHTHFLALNLSQQLLAIGFDVCLEH